MKNAIKEYLEYSEEEKRELWGEAVFVFDTNVLLNLYRYSEKTRDALLSAMTRLNERIWMPHQVAEEFMKRRVEIIYESEDRYKRLEESALSPFREKLRVNDDDPEFQKLQKYIGEWIQTYKEKNLTVTDASKDSILEKLFTLFSNRVGAPYSEEELGRIKKDGELRYKQRVPPGYKDGGKAKDGNDNNAYGDLIVWKQIINYASKEKVDIVFVTGDKKEDWWSILHGKTIGPRIELRKEFMQQAQTRFHMYSMEEFIARATPAIEKAVDESVIEEVKAYATPPFSGLAAMQRFIGRRPLNDAEIDTIPALEREIASLEEKNARRRSALEGIYESCAGKDIPDQVEEIVSSMKRDIQKAQMRLFTLRARLNYLMHSPD